MQCDGQAVYNSTGDADTMIVVNTLRITSEGNEVNVVADDTDVLILLMHHWMDTIADIFFSETKKSQKKSLQVWKIHDLISKAGKIVTDHLLFIHAWTGCDTTSATFGHGKANLLKKIQEIQRIAHLMYNYSVMPEEVSRAGKRLFLIIFGGKDGDSCIM